MIARVQAWPQAKWQKHMSLPNVWASKYMNHVFACLNVLSRWVIAQDYIILDSIPGRIWNYLLMVYIYLPNYK